MEDIAKFGFEAWADVVEVAWLCGLGRTVEEAERDAVPVSEKKTEVSTIHPEFSCQRKGLERYPVDAVQQLTEIEIVQLEGCRGKVLSDSRGDPGSFGLSPRIDRLRLELGDFARWRSVDRWICLEVPECLGRKQRSSMNNRSARKQNDRNA